MYAPKSIYTRIALETLLAYLKGGDTDELYVENVPDELFEIRRGCFVSLHLTSGELRGCIGTIEPVEENLYKEIVRNAVSSASRDSRFSPVTLDEMDGIEISVDVLSEAETVFSPEELDPAKYGLIISDGNYRRGILLPGLEGVDTVEQQISIVKRKAGLEKYDDGALKYYRFTSKRYY
ncbi:MAG: AmmeMemoRadiSam system protein A [Chlorobi bacterium]|nr:AmmeMemoRadiSam system protein A [Chlorobiota bacterium]